MYDQCLCRTRPSRLWTDDEQPGSRLLGYRSAGHNLDSFQIAVSCESPSVRTESGHLRFWRLAEIQSVAVQIAHSELSPPIEGIVNVLHELDPMVMVRLASKTRLRRLKLPRLEQLVEVIDLVCVKPYAHIVRAFLSVHCQHKVGFAERQQAPVHHPVILVSRDFFEPDRRVPGEGP